MEGLDCILLELKFGNSFVTVITRKGYQACLESGLSDVSITVRF